jgi:hypothetical protein
MARARVTLREGISLKEGNRTFLKNKPQILTNPFEIERYRLNGRFDVKDLADEKPKAKAKGKAKTADAEDSGDEKKKTGKKKKG